MLSIILHGRDQTRCWNRVSLLYSDDSLSSHVCHVTICVGDFQKSSYFCGTERKEIKIQTLRNKCTTLTCASLLSTTSNYKKRCAYQNRSATMLTLQYIYLQQDKNYIAVGHHIISLNIFMLNISNRNHRLSTFGMYSYGWPFFFRWWIHPHLTQNYNVCSTLISTSITVWIQLWSGLQCFLLWLKQIQKQGFCFMTSNSSTQTSVLLHAYWWGSLGGTQ